MVGEATFSREDLDETIKIFQGLIRIDTTNPPGNEGKAAEYLKACFESNGVDCEVLGEPGRENAVAKLKGLKNKPRLLLLSHTDVVPVADVGVWTHPPFSGDIAGKWIYGRGACDDKFDAAVQAMCLIILKRQNIKLNGALMSASVADEEVAGSGAEWLTKKVPEKVASEYVIGEGGGPCLELGSRKAFPIMLGEKGLVWFKLAAKGKAGHGSIPTLASNANVTMAEAFIRLSSLKTEVTLVKEVLQEIDTVVRGLFGDEHGTKMLDQHLNERQLDTLLEAVVQRQRGCGGVESAHENDDFTQRN